MDGVSVDRPRVPVVNEWGHFVVQSYARMRPSFSRQEISSRLRDGLGVPRHLGE